MYNSLNFTKNNLIMQRIIKEIFMKNEENKKRSYPKIPDLMFQDVKIPEDLAPTAINPALSEANQIIIPRNPGPALHGLDWDVPDEPLVTDKRVHATPNPHTNKREYKKKKQK